MPSVTFDTKLDALTLSANLVDQLVLLGHKRGKAKQITVRLVQVRHGKSWYNYITSVLEPEELPPYVVADLYCRRWEIETAFFLVKGFSENKFCNAVIK